jgi:Spy/CpxP family protein refolding chaperone
MTADQFDSGKRLPAQNAGGLSETCVPWPIDCFVAAVPFRGFQNGTGIFVVIVAQDFLELWNLPTVKQEYRWGEERKNIGVVCRISRIGRNSKMSSKHKIMWVLALLLAAPMLASRAPAAPYQGGGYGGGQGEGGRRGPMSPDDRLKRMTKDFNLTADQQSKIKPILVDEQKKMEDLRNDSSVDRQSMRGKIMQIRQDTNDQVRALLDDKQKEKFDKQEQQRVDRTQNRRGGGPGGNPPPQY